MQSGLAALADAGLSMLVCVCGLGLQRLELLAGASVPALQRQYQSTAEAAAGSAAVTDSLKRTRAMLAQQLDQTSATMSVLGANVRSCTRLHAGGSLAARPFTPPPPDVPSTIHVATCVPGVADLTHAHCTPTPCRLSQTMAT